MKNSTLPIYFDNHATTPVDPRVLEVMLPYFTEHFGNAESSQHAYGWKAKSAVDQARAQVAALLGAEPAEILFTSGATESINLAILGSLTDQTGRHIITANSEHKATLEVCARAAKSGHSVTILPVDKFGRITPEQVEAALRPETALVSLMHANNEIGTIHPIAEIGALLKKREGILFHVDAAQTFGKHPIDVRAMNIDLLSISSHKLYGPKGIGALFVRRTNPRVHLTPYVVGGGQERGLRGGTHNVPGIVGLGKACSLSLLEMNEESPRLRRLRDHIVQSVQSSVEGVELNGHPTERLCNNINFTLRGVSEDSLLLGLKDIAFSSASACSAGVASHVLQAIGKASSDPTVSSVRFGLGRFTTEAEVETLIRRLVDVVQNARTNSASYQL